MSNYWNNPTPQANSYPTQKIERTVRRQRGFLENLGMKTFGTETKPTWLRAALELWSALPYGTVNLTEAIRKGKDPMAGFMAGAYAGARPMMRKLGFRNLPPVRGGTRREMWTNYLPEIMNVNLPEYAPKGSPPGIATWINFLPSVLGLGLDLAQDPFTWGSAGTTGIVRQAMGSMARRVGKGFSLATKEGIAKAAKGLAEDEMQTAAKLGLPGIEKAGKIFTTLDELTEFNKKAIEKAYKSEGPFNLRPKTVWSRKYKRMPLTPTYEQWEKSPMVQLGKMLKLPYGVEAVKQLAAKQLQGKFREFPEAEKALPFKAFFTPRTREVPVLNDWLREDISPGAMPMQKSTTRPPPPAPPAAGPPPGPTGPLPVAPVAPTRPRPVSGPPILPPPSPTGPLPGPMAAAMKRAGVGPTFFQMPPGEVLPTIEARKDLQMVLEEARTPQNIAAELQVRPQDPEAAAVLESVSKDPLLFKKAKEHLEVINEPKLPRRKPSLPGMGMAPKDSARRMKIIDELLHDIYAKGMNPNDFLTDVGNLEKKFIVDIDEIEKLASGTGKRQKSYQALLEWLDAGDPGFKKEAYAKLRNASKNEIPLHQVNFGNKENRLQWREAQIARKVSDLQYIEDAYGPAAREDWLAKEKALAEENQWMEQAPGQWPIKEVGPEGQKVLDVNLKMGPELKFPEKGVDINRLFEEKAEGDFAKRYAEEAWEQGLPFSAGPARPGLKKFPGGTAARPKMPLEEAVKQGHLSEEHYRAVKALMDESPTFRKNVEFRYTPELYKAPLSAEKAHGEVGPKMGIRGWAELSDAGKQILALTRNADILTAPHELVHFAEKHLFLPEEKQLIRRLHSASGSLKNSSEWVADNLAAYIAKRPVYKGLEGIVRRLWDTFVRLVRTLRPDSKIAGQAKIEQVFERAAKRPLQLPGTEGAPVIEFSAGPSVKGKNTPKEHTVEWTDPDGTKRSAKARVFKVGLQKSFEVPRGSLVRLEQAPKKWMVRGPAEKSFAVFTVPVTTEPVTFYEKTGLTKFIDSMISPISRQHGIDPVLIELGRAMEARMLMYKRKSLDAATEFAKKLPKLEDVHRFHQYVENPGALKLTPLEERKFEDARILRDNWTEKPGPGTPGGIIPQLLQTAKGMQNFRKNYISHIIESRPGLWGELETIVNQSEEAILKSSSGLSTFEKFQLTQGLDTIDELLAKGYGVKKNAAETLAIRIYSGFRVAELADYVKNLQSPRYLKAGFLKKMGAINEAPPPGYIAMTATEVGSELFPQFKGYHLRKDVYLHLIHEFESWRTTIPYFNIAARAQRLWKPLATIWNIKYHMQNMLGNVWNNYLAGVTNPARYIQALAIQSPKIDKMLGGLKFRVMGQEVDATTIREMLQKEGIVERGAFTADLDELLSRQISREIGQKMSLKERFKQMPLTVGQSIEDNARIALSLDRLIKGDHAIDMANTTREFLFDYDEITPFEKAVRRNVLPWYVWYRKNIPLQLKMMMRQPGKFTAIPKVTAAIEGKKEKRLREEIEPEWMKENYAFTTPSLSKARRGRKRYFVPNIPWQDPFKYLDNPRQILSAMNPVIVTILENLTKEDIGTGRKFEEEGLEGMGLSGSRVENIIGKLPKKMWPLLDIHQWRDPNTGQLNTTMNPRLYRLWKTIFRPGREIMSLTDEQKSLLSRAMNMFITTTELEPEKQRFINTYVQQKKNEAALKAIYKRQGTPLQRRRYR